MPIHYLQIVDDRSELTPFQKKCMESVKCRVGEKDTYEVVPVKYNPNPGQLIYDIDTIKVTRASQDGKLCVVDTDCFLAAGFDPEKLVQGKPYFGEYSFDKAEGIPDIFLFYVNGCTDYFQKYLPTRFLSPARYSFDRELFRNLKGFELFPPLMYIHYYSTMRQVVLNQQITAISRASENATAELVQLRRFVEQMAMTMKTFDKLNEK